MRYKTPIPLSYTQEHYLELSDSDDEGVNNGDGKNSAARFRSRPERVSIVGGNAGAANTVIKIKKGSAAVVPAKIQFKREANINRERPVSGSMFRSIAEVDPELKVSVLLFYPTPHY